MDSASSSAESPDNQVAQSKFAADCAGQGVVAGEVLHVRPPARSKYRGIGSEHLVAQHKMRQLRRTRSPGERFAKSVTRMRNNRSRSVALCVTVSRLVFDQVPRRRPQDRWQQCRSRACLGSVSSSTTPSCTMAENRRSRIAPDNQAGSAFTSTAIILRSRSSAVSLGSTQRLRRSTRSLARRNLVRSLRCAPQLLRSQTKVFQQDRRVVGAKRLAA
jgi:hypothetical protein